MVIFEPSAHISVGCFYHESPRRIGRGHASAELLIKNLVAYSRRSFPLADGGTRANGRADISYDLRAIPRAIGVRIDGDPPLTVLAKDLVGAVSLLNLRDEAERNAS